MQIPQIIEKVLGQISIIDNPEMHQIDEADREARILAKKFLQ
jgi:hypothetical protein